MKWIYGAIFFQALLTGAIFIKLYQLEARQLALSGPTAGLNPAHACQHGAEAVLSAPADPSPQLAPLQLASLQADLSILLARLDELARPGTAGPVPASDLATPPTADQMARHQQLQNALHSLKFSGPVSQHQLEALQLQAAQLHPAQRQQMFTDIARAVNSGQLQLTH